MRIGIIGAGHVGGTLGRRWAEAGHEVVFGVRSEPDDELRQILDGSGGRARAASVADAAAAGEVVVFATPWPATQEAVANAGGKVVIDCTNPLGEGMKLQSAAGASAAEKVAGWARGARVVKAFNTTGFNNMADPRYPDGPASMLVCGDDAQAKQTAMRLASDIGFEPVDAGPLKQAYLLEHLAMLWISLAFGGQGRDIAWRLMRR